MPGCSCGAAGSNYTIDETGRGRRGSARWRLRLDIHTSGGPSPPDDAMARQPIQLMRLFPSPGAASPWFEEPLAWSQERLPPKARCPLEEPDLSVSRLQLLKRAQVNSVLRI